ncbi:MAG: hypothetical protein CMD07_01205 [Flavobacteriales bacterium]|nr:hypothetical protein [Flavobacteriales bacterium]|tara:strand:- start:4311 stop:5192 length:882 start_codon:yes stop_codon:yes gene_type:complete
MLALFNHITSESSRKRIEKMTLFLALFFFIAHLVIIYLIKFNYLNINPGSGLFSNPISAIYTPFSFILVYEVYLLIYYLPKSFTNYLTKQYEIITLIIIRRLFKDLSSIEISSNWFELNQDLQFTYDIIASIILFYLIFLFNKQSEKLYKEKGTSESIKNFIYLKKIIAFTLVPIFFFLATYTLVNWVVDVLQTSKISNFSGINNLFFDEFFTILILVDVVLLLISFFYTDKFHKIIRNSGFIISTILIRMSFGADGLISTLLIVTAVIFGLAIITIHNKFESESFKNNPQNT